MVMKSESYRKILDTADVTANSVAALIVEHVGNKLDRKDLTDLCQSTSAAVKKHTDQLIDVLQNLEN